MKQARGGEGKVGDMANVDDLIPFYEVTSIDKGFFAFITKGEGVIGKGRFGKRWFLGVLPPKSHKTKTTINMTKYDVLLI